MKSHLRLTGGRVTMGRFLVGVLVAALAFHAGALPAGERPGYSGMVRIADNTFLTVNDRKNPIQPGARLGILTVTPRDGTFFHPLSVTDWADAEKDPSDLEACCDIPGRPGEYLLAESGHFRKKFGRIFHVRVGRDADGGWQAEALRAFRAYDRALDEQGTTWEGDQVEGIACFPAFDRTILVYGERGGLVKGGRKPGRLVWGELDLATYQFRKLGEEDLAAKSVLGERDCSDLLLKPNGDAWQVWSVATKDAGNAGPFHSVVFRAGAFVLDRDRREFRFVRESQPAAQCHLAGLKVEALAAPAKCVPESGFSVGTDDEGFGGVWRPLFK